MRRPLRTVHVVLWLILAILLPLGLIIGLSLRQERPIEIRTFPPSQTSPQTLPQQESTP